MIWFLSRTVFVVEECHLLAFLKWSQLSEICCVMRSLNCCFELLRSEVITNMTNQNVKRANATSSENFLPQPLESNLAMSCQ